MNRVVWIILSAAFALGLWQAIVTLTNAPHFILPSPARTFTTLYTSRALIAENAVITIAAVLAGFFIGSALGIITAIQLMMSETLRRLFMPMLVFIQSMPIFALAPIFTLWLGFGIGSKIAMAILITYFPVVVNFLDGLQRTDKGLLDLAHTMRAKPLQVLWRIRIPAALPSLGSGLKLAAVYAPIGAIIGEWVGASKGLGYLMLLANGRAKIDLMFASLIVLAVFTVILHWVVSKAADRMARRAIGLRQA